MQKKIVTTDIHLHEQNVLFSEGGRFSPMALAIADAYVVVVERFARVSRADNGVTFVVIENGEEVMYVHRGAYTTREIVLCPEPIDWEDEK